MQSKRSVNPLTENKDLSKEKTNLALNLTVGIYWTVSNQILSGLRINFSTLAMSTPRRMPSDSALSKMRYQSWK